MNNRTIERIIEAVQNLYVETPTTTNVLVSEGKPAKGVEVFVSYTNNELVLAPDGEYKTPNNLTIYVVKDGRIAKIIKK